VIIRTISRHPDDAEHATMHALIEQSLWRSRPTPRFPAPISQLPNEVDVAIIGGGITGLTTAYLLKQSGKRVAVFEREHIGAGETGNTSAHLTYVTDTRLAELAQRFGEDTARRVYAAGATAIDLLETNALDHGMSCNFRRVPGFLCAPFCSDELDPDTLKHEAALAGELGFAAQYTSVGPVGNRPAVAYADQAVFHPLEYISGLAHAVNGDGSFVVDGAEVGAMISDPLGVIVSGRTIACRDIVIATHVPLMGNSSLPSALFLQTKLYPYSTYVVGARLDDGSLMPGLYSDIADPYYYLRVHEDAGGRYAIFGGADHKTGQESDTEACFKQVGQVLGDLLPMAKLERRWSGQVIETDDGLPFIGVTADHQFVATGYAGNGLTFGTIAGMMLRDAIMSVEHPLAKALDPHRKATSVAALSTLIAENVDYPLHFVADRLTQDTSSTVRDLARGDARVLMIGGKRVACHRTEAGELVKVSAVCTHLGCLVRWNSAEHTWDCPCHGSRFTPEGLVIGGPAESPLQRVD
jgi:glycine/D-amino acid oxidase-like deaminating enzyme/nitrite reductase/ring-hydroxylating ferredoxin subunit